MSNTPNTPNTPNNAPPRRRLVGVTSTPAPTPGRPVVLEPSAEAPPRAVRGAMLLDDDEAIGDDFAALDLVPPPGAGVAGRFMFPLLWDFLHSVPADKLAEWDALESRLPEVHRWRIVLFKWGAPEGASKRQWLSVGGYEEPAECTQEAIRARFGPGVFRCYVYAVCSDANGEDRQVNTRAFGFALAAPLEAPPAPAPAPAPAAGALRSGASSAISAMPGAPPGGFGPSSFLEFIQWQQAQAQIELARAEAAEKAEERRRTREREEQERREREEDRRLARAREEEERRARDEERRARRLREDREEREREEDRRDRRAKDLEARLMDARAAQVSATNNPAESLKTYVAALEEVKGLVGADGDREVGGSRWAQVLTMLGEGIGPHLPKIIEVAGTAITNSQRIAQLETQFQGAIAIEQARRQQAQQAPAAPVPPAPNAPRAMPAAAPEPAPAPQAAPEPAPAPAPSHDHAGAPPADGTPDHPPGDPSPAAGAPVSAHQAPPVADGALLPGGAPEVEAVGPVDVGELDPCPECGALDPCSHDAEEDEPEECEVCPECPHGPEDEDEHGDCRICPPCPHGAEAEAAPAVAAPVEAAPAPASIALAPASLAELPASVVLPPLGGFRGSR